MIRVVNKRKHVPTDDGTYIGRGSPLGNSYSIGHSDVAGTISVPSREEAIRLYAGWLDKAYPDVAAVRSAIDKLVLRELQNLDTNLVCYCAPAPCHGIVIRNKVLEILEKIHNLT